jgi:predicted MFS family arabinose efflux permease
MLILIIAIALCGIFIQIVTRGALGTVIQWFSAVFYPKTVTIENATNIALEEDGTLLITDSGNQRIVRANTNGSYNALIYSGRDTFNWVTEARPAPDGGVFINDQTLGDDGISIIAERLIHYDVKTGERKTLLSYEYPAAGTPLHLPRLFGPFAYGSTLLAAKTSAGRIEVIDIYDNRILFYVPLENAEYAVSSCDTDGTLLWFIHKKGAVYKAGADGNLVELYAGGGEMFSTPWKLTRTAEGTIFFSDIGERVIKSLSGGVIRTVFAAGEGGSEYLPFNEQPIYYALAAEKSGNTAAIAFDNIMIKNSSGGMALFQNTFVLDNSLLLRRLAAAGVLLFFALLTLVCIIKLAIFCFRRIQIKPDFILVFAITLIVAAALVVALPVTYREGMRSYIDNTFVQLSALAQAGAHNIDSAALEKVNSPEDYMSGDYMRVWNSLRDLINENYEWNKSIYCVLYKYQNNILYTPIFMDGYGGAYYPYDYESESLAMVFSQGKIVRTDADIASDGTWMYIHGPVYNKSREIIGAIEVGLNLVAFQTKYKKLYLSIVFAVIAASVILQMIVMQVIKTIEYLDERKKIAKLHTLRYEPVEFVNPTVFLLFFIFNMVSSFVPNYCAQLYKPVSQFAFFANFPREFMEALPVSLHLLAVGIGCAFTGITIRKIGFRKTVAIGGIFMLASCVLIALITEYFSFTLLFFIMGLGFGFMSNAVSGNIAAIPDPAKRAIGFSYYNSSLFSGFCCGTVIGAALAESFGGQAVFLFSGLAVIFPVIILSFFFKNHPPPAEQKLSLAASMKKSVLAFLCRPDTLSFFVLSLLPYTLSGYFMFYFMPRFAEESLGLSQSVIGQLFLVHGIAVLLFSTALTRFTARHFSSNAICLSLVLIAGAFLAFAVMPCLITLIAALFILGLASSFGAASLSSYYVTLAPVKKYGYEKSMSVYQTIEMSGDTLAPIVFGYALSGSLQKNFLMFTAIIIIVLLGIALIPKREAGDAAGK